VVIWPWPNHSGERLANLRENHLGREHLWTARARAELAGILSHLGKRKEAAALLTQTLKLRTARLPVAHPAVWKNQVGLAEVQQASNEHRAVVAGLREYLKSLAGIIPPASCRIVELESLLGESMIKVRDFPGAEQLLLKAYHYQSEDVPDPVEGRGATRQRLAQLYDAWGKPSEAVKYAQP
jgi:hypothetical protein